MLRGYENTPEDYERNETFNNSNENETRINKLTGLFNNLTQDMTCLKCLV